MVSLARAMALDLDATLAVLTESAAYSRVMDAKAEKMIAAYDDAYAKGLGAVQFEGAMIDVPVVERARTVLKRAAAIRKRVGA